MNNFKITRKTISMRFMNLKTISLRSCFILGTFVICSKVIINITNYRQCGWSFETELNFYKSNIVSQEIYCARANSNKLSSDLWICLARVDLRVVYLLTKYIRLIKISLGLDGLPALSIIDNVYDFFRTNDKFPREKE